MNRLQAVQRVQRLARGEGIRVDAVQFGLHGGGLGCAGFGRRGKQVHLRAAGLLLGLERFKRGSRLAHQRGGHAGQARHLHAVAAAGGAGLDGVH